MTPAMMRIFFPCNQLSVACQRLAEIIQTTLAQALAQALAKAFQISDNSSETSEASKSKATEAALNVAKAFTDLDKPFEVTEPQAVETNTQDSPPGSGDASNNNTVDEQTEEEEAVVTPPRAAEDTVTYVETPSVKSLDNGDIPTAEKTSDDTPIPDAVPAPVETEKLSDALGDVNFSNLEVLRAHLLPSSNIPKDEPHVKPEALAIESASNQVSGHDEDQASVKIQDEPAELNTGTKPQELSNDTQVHPTIQDEPEETDKYETTSEGQNHSEDETGNAAPEELAEPSEATVNIADDSSVQRPPSDIALSEDPSSQDLGQGPQTQTSTTQETGTQTCGQDPTIQSSSCGWCSC
jgi:hypothetical protein